MNTTIGLVWKNEILITTIIAWAVSQGIKIILGIFREKKFDFRWILSPGGVPSTHASGVAALATSSGLILGFDSGYFAIASILALVVMFDAQGVRHAAGKQAQILNKIMEDVHFKRKIHEERLRELLGHTPFEVFLGAFIGILVAIIIVL
ncbi:MAG: divergent PAP2 family protein [Candidatus Omnitrophota bacterium]